MKFLTVFENTPVSPPPVWMMRQAGRYLPEYRETRARAGDFLSLCLNPELATEVTLQPIRRYGFDASILFADILLIPHAMGQPLAYREGEGPVLEPVRDRAQVARLAGDSAERLSPVYQTVRNLRAALPAEVALIGFAGAPWTVAAYMVEGRGGKGFVAARRWAFSDPDGFQTLIDMVTEATIHYLLAQIEAGANAIQIFDSWAGLLPASQLERWVIRPTRRIVEALKARHPQVPVIGFPRGVGPAVPAYCAGTGVDGVSLDESLDPAWAAQAVPAGVVLQGNMDPQFVVAGGPAMRAEADRILAVLAGRPHIFNLGHGLVPETPPEHVGELVAHIRAPVGAGA